MEEELKIIRRINRAISELPSYSQQVRVLTFVLNGVMDMKTNELEGKCGHAGLVGGVGLDVECRKKQLEAEHAAMLKQQAERA